MVSFPSLDLKNTLASYTFAIYTIGGVTGTFEKWETITGGGSGATAIVVEQSATQLTVYEVAGTMLAEAITGGTSGATATISAIVVSNPSIRMRFDDHPSAHASDGEIVMEDDKKVNSLEWVGFRRSSYNIPVTVSIDGQTDSTKLQALKGNIQHVFDAENKKTDRPYYYSILYDWNGLVRLGSIDLIVSAIKEFESI